MMIASGWSWAILIVGGALLWAAVMVVALALCAAMADPDEVAQVDAAEAERAALGRVCSGGAS